jgi:hypothetical protein
MFDLSLFGGRGGGVGYTNYLTRSCMGVISEKFKDTKWVVSDCKVKRDRQCNDQKKMNSRTNNDLQNTT